MVMMTMVAVMVIGMVAVVVIAVTNMDIQRGTRRVRMTICSLIFLRNRG
jgi:hypothetical protein